MSLPEPASRSRAAVARPAILRPLEKFLHVEAASGVVLLTAAVAALIWANSPWADSYEALWHAQFALQLGGLSVSESLHFIINDVFMTVFFLVVGLEIRREIHDGALANLRLATLPIFAAAGGVVAPALIYLGLNATPELRHGWAVPTATDIAFALGVLALLGKRVPASLRVLLLALAIIDDIIAILIIALFYSSGVQLLGAGIAVAGAVLVFTWQVLGLRSAWSYVVPGAVVWFGVLQAQVHPAIAGVVLGLLTPVRTAAQRDTLIEMARHSLDRLLGEARESAQIAAPVRRLDSIQRESLAPAARVQMALHPWVAFGIMPLFAFANSGVSLQSVSMGSMLSGSVSLGVLLGLTLGKPMGILLASFIAVRLRLSVLPPQASMGGLLLVGCLGGIGFTMAIFIANLAFASPALLAQAKLAILMGSATSGVVGLIVGWVVLPKGG
ncbi:MAG: Na+/H+ antiporter NhaA [Steroidobacteraceae bacterium]